MVAWSFLWAISKTTGLARPSRFPGIPNIGNSAAVDAR
jgi:hypothetical protein